RNEDILQSYEKNFFVNEDESDDHSVAKPQDFSMIKEACDQLITPMSEDLSHVVAKIDAHAEECISSPVPLKYPTRKQQTSPRLLLTEEHENDIDQQSKCASNCDGLVPVPKNDVAMNASSHSVEFSSESKTYKQKLYDLEQELRDIRRILEMEASLLKSTSVPTFVALEDRRAIPNSDGACNTDLGDVSTISTKSIIYK
ncbi:hypothetical protein ACHAXS_012020, partial [Conticribra weissflogii]